MNILDQIVAHKQKEVAERKSLYPVKLLEKSIYFESQPVSLKKYLLRPDKVGIIAEFKRKSPSKGMINPYVAVERTSVGYMQAGASALSILTDTAFFGGKNEDLITARKFNFCPILRKDFTIDEYQIIEAKSIGADAILLIAAILSPEQIRSLAAVAKSLKMEVLLEVHDQQELERSLTPDVDALGVNNRNLKDFTVDINLSKTLAPIIPDDFVKVSESGISEAETVADLATYGYKGFLMGETFMKNSRPEKACAAFIDRLRVLI
ncbi:indole-3-glycerol phosphate synthase TrpC [Rhodocytophaga aerolata]|uniref:Indole-3-glycerol phosphate synthase n=1 Tax=Rhodocytophaga aerolata TaxID=455078 RepID=A0ABT8REW6_9BACT|nr:indole-3-glycerol phosphate synthase TrpC [Rhodocytophaga aerolata]MDO1450615.1 indole-3-glycerol phosphate synthase TrpC [Rhodocytophaga aerolata]